MRLTEHTSFWILSISVLCALLIPTLVQQGMFIDGVTYAAISNNLALGEGSMWVPHYTQSLHSEFLEHPPAFFWLQSVFFVIFGSSYLTESLFSFSMALATIWSIWFLFKSITQSQSYSWMPVLLWTISPIIFWSYKNNMLENVTSPLILFAIAFYYKAFKSKKIIQLIIGSTILFFASLVKGPVVLFPLGVCGLMWLITKERTIIAAITYTALALLSIIVMYAVLFTSIPEAKAAILQYVDQQIFASIEGTREVTSNSRFDILYKLAEHIAPAILLVGVLFLGVRNRIQTKIEYKQALLFTAIGLLGVLPFMVSLKQTAYYLVPVIPIFAIAIALIGIQLFKEIKIRKPIFIGFAAIILFAVTIVLASINFGTYGRYAELQNDIAITSEYFNGERALVDCDEELQHHWALIAYLIRFEGISIQNNTNSKVKYTTQNFGSALYPKVYNKTQSIHLAHKWE